MSFEVDAHHFTEADARALHDDRLDYELYTGRSTNLNEFISWEKKAGGDYLMQRSKSPSSLGRSKKAPPVSASLMALGYVSRESCFISPRWMVSSEYSSASRKHSIRLVSARGFQAFEESFRNTWETLKSIQDSNLAWNDAEAKKFNLLEGESADTGGMVVLKLPAYTTPNPDDPWDKGDWKMVDEWDGDNKIKTEIREIMDTGRVPQLLKVYDNETRKRLTANEIEAKLPGALVEVIFGIKHNYLRQHKSHSFSATIQQIIILQSLEEEPMPSIFDHHDPLVGPLILSPGKKRVHEDMVTAEEYENANSQASPSKRSRKTATTKKSPPRGNTRASRRRTKQKNDVKAVPKGKGKQKALVLDIDSDEGSTDDADTVKSE